MPVTITLIEPQADSGDLALKAIPEVQQQGGPLQSASHIFKLHKCRTTVLIMTLCRSFCGPTANAS